ncbi:MAG TPA: TolC family protein, partial [Kaistiaceae bacterium]|nr:TolC family protein [Kaistiaceae bacterium]
VAETKVADATLPNAGPAGDKPAGDKTLVTGSIGGKAAREPAVTGSIAVPPRDGAALAGLSMPANSDMRAISEEVADHPDVLAAREREAASGDEIRKARAAYLPSLSLDSAVGIDRIVQGNGKGDPDLNPYSYGVKAELTVFDGFQRRHKLMRAKADRDATVAATRDTVQQTLVDAVTLLAQSVRDKAILDHRRAYMKRLDAVMRETRARKREGDASDTDVQQVRTRIEAANSSIRLAEGSLAETDAQLRRYLTSLKLSALQLKDLARALPPSREAAAREALDNNPMLERANMRAEAAEEERLAARGAMMPRVAVVGEVKSEGEQYENDKHNTDLQVGLQLSMPIFTGGSRIADMSQKKHEAHAARHEADSARRLVVAGVDGAWGRLEENDKALISSQARIAAARRALKGVEASHDIDESSTLDVLNAHQEVMTAEIEREEFLYTGVVTRHLLLAQVGRLDDVYGLRDQGKMASR